MVQAPVNRTTSPRISVIRVSTPVQQFDNGPHISMMNGFEKSRLSVPVFRLDQRWTFIKGRLHRFDVAGCDELNEFLAPRGRTPLFVKPRLNSFDNGGVPAV
jgi:hypothetical protein